MKDVRPRTQGPEPSAARLAPRALSTGVVDSLGGGFCSYPWVKYGQPREEGSDWKTSPHIRPYMIDMRYIFEHANALACRCHLFKIILVNGFN